MVVVMCPWCGARLFEVRDAECQKFYCSMCRTEDGQVKMWRHDELAKEMKK